MGNIITALFALIGSFIGSVIVSKSEHKKRFNETVSQRRVDWIRQMSVHIGTVIAAITLLSGEHLKKVLDKNTDNRPSNIDETTLLFNYYKSKNHLLSQLNTSEPEHQMLISLLNQLDEFIDKVECSDFNSIRDGILDIVRLIEKIEWDKTKNEARGIKG